MGYLRQGDELLGATVREVIVGGRPDHVWAAKDYSAYLYTKDAKDYRDKEIFKFDDANVAQMTIVNAHGTLSFTKGDKWVGTLDKNAIPDRMSMSVVDRFEMIEIESNAAQWMVVTCR